MITKLIEEYTDTAKHLRKYHQSLDRSDPEQADESRLVSGMISDMQYALQWMRQGRRPGNLRGAEITDVYRQRELFKTLSDRQNDVLSDFDRQKLVQCLLTLSERERTCFLLHMAHGLTYVEIGDRLEISRNTVRTFVDRAKRKVQQGIA